MVTIRPLLAAAAIAFLLAAGLAACGNRNDADPAAKSGPADSEGTIHVPSYSLPPSAYLSPEARAALPGPGVDPQAPMRLLRDLGLVPPVRALIPLAMRGEVAALKQKHRVSTQKITIAGIEAIRVTPEYVAPENEGKLLLNLPGGGFLLAHAGGSGMQESIPLAAATGLEIITITYRQAPEYQWPAGVIDVATVYQKLLETYDPADIGIFGCSAGGMLTAQSIAWFIEHDIPVPGAIGIHCAAADVLYQGDSRNWGRALMGLEPKPWVSGYFRETDLNNPLVSPVLSPELLARFPPTLLISSTRAVEMSGAVNTHRQLIKAGVKTELHLWDGLYHAFFTDPDLPESAEAFSVQAAFFAKHLELIEGKPTTSF